MQFSALNKLCGSLPPILLLFLLLGGCSSPANVQDSATDHRSGEQSQALPEKTSDLSGLWLLPQIDGPLSNILQTQGVTLPPQEIYDSQNASLNQAVAKIKTGENQAGTGSFVSPNGLLLTNYSSAIQGIAENSSRNQNHIHSGFTTSSKTQEIPLENYSLLVTIEQKEVTQQINQQLPDSLTYRQKKKQKQEIQKQLIADRQSSNNSLLVQINDAWDGNRQFMSVYKVIRDVRLVHAPSNPSFKESAAYALLRAYVSPDGEGKEYDQSNIPFQPEKHFAIADKWANSNDLLLTLGFPGATQRFESSYAIEFYHKNRNPVLIDTYKAIFDAAQYAADQDSATAIENAPLRSSLNHNLTYYKAIQQGIDQYDIISKKQSEEEGLTKWIKQDSLRNIKYRRVLSQLDQSYRIASQTGDLLFTLVNTINNSKILQIANLYNSYYEHISDTANTDVSSTNKQKIFKQHQRILSDNNVEAQTQMLGDMLYTLATLPDGKVPFHLIELFGDTQKKALKNEISSYLEKQRRQSIVYNPNRANELLNLPADSAREQPKDKLVMLYGELLNSYQFSRKNYSQHVPYLQPAQELFVQGLLKFRNDTMSYPDANGTLRLSMGKLKTPQAGENMEATSETDTQEAKGKVLVTTNDITGGSLGSPVLNSSGKLIGVVVKRSPESMINDLLVKSDRSHTIALDIRHITTRLSEFSEGMNLLKEMQLSRDNE